MNEEKFKTIQQKIEKDYENITGIIVQKNNQLLYEHYFNDCDVSSKIHVYSISKSILPYYWESLKDKVLSVKWIAQF